MNNPMVREIVQMRMRGMTPLQARQQLAQRYPQLGQAAPFMQGQTPQEIDKEDPERTPLSARVYPP